MLSTRAYRKQIIHTWNEIAPRYHKRVKMGGDGPFESTKKMISMAHISKGQHVLDIACGTGAVSHQILQHIGHNGLVVGIDVSYTALCLARRYVQSDNFHPVICDAENVRFSKKSFDAATCQFGLFFFANAQKVLKNIKKALKPNGILAIAVHGYNTPFYSSILDAVTEFIPQYKEPGTPDMTRFSTRKALSSEIKNAGFSRIHSSKFTFMYSPGTFEQYWRKYLAYAPKIAREKINKLSISEKRELKKQIKKNVAPYEKNNNTIKFPWDILITTARKP